MNVEMIKELSDAFGPSGYESEVCQVIKKYSAGFEIHNDPMFNTYMKHPNNTGTKPVLMLDAHMDEVGMMITHINSDGTLDFDCVGGIDKRVLLGRPVTVGENKVKGVIGVKATHMVPAAEKLSMPSTMYIDIGADSEEEAKKVVALGDYACFNSEFVEFGDGFIKGRALDDRAGCAILIDMIKSDLPYDMYFNFAAGEEVGFGIAQTAFYKVQPDYAIVVETTTAADLADVPENKKVCELGKGGVISFMDRRTIYPKELFDKAFELAEKNGIKAQVKSLVAGGNNAGVIHKTAGGVKTIAVSLPCRYLHSPSCVLKKDDIEESAKLIRVLSEEFANG